MDGVESVETDVEGKTVVVQADAAVTPEMMLEKLKKVRTAFQGQTEETGYKRIALANKVDRLRWKTNNRCAEKALIVFFLISSFFGCSGAMLVENTLNWLNNNKEHILDDTSRPPLYTGNVNTIETTLIHTKQSALSAICACQSTLRPLDFSFIDSDEIVDLPFQSFNVVMVAA